MDLRVACVSLWTAIGGQVQSVAPVKYHSEEIARSVSKHTVYFRRLIYRNDMRDEWLHPDFVMAHEMQQHAKIVQAKVA